MKKTKRLLSVLLAAMMLSGILAGCTTTGSTPSAQSTQETSGQAGETAQTTEAAGSSSDVIKIGVFEPITGANAAGGALEVEGVELAHELRPTVLGKTVELVTADNKSDKVEAATAASRLIEKDGVVAIIGSWGSSNSIGAGDVVKQGKTPAVGASCTNPLVTQGNEWYFRVCFIDPYQGKVMANYAYYELGARTAGIIRENGSDYSVGLAKYFEDAFKELTGDPNCIVATADYQTGDQDFNAQVTNVASANPDVIFAPGNFTESAMVIKQARQLGYDMPFLGGDTWETPEFVEVGGSEVDGAVFSTFFDSNADLTPATKVFVDAYKAKYNQEPAAVTALSYDAYNLILDAIEACGTTDSETLRQAIEDTDNFAGAAGYVTFDENGDATKNAVIKEVKNGEFTYLTTVDASK